MLSFSSVVYDWNTSINGSVWFLRFFSRNHFLEGRWGLGTDHEVHHFWCGGREGGWVQKNYRMGGGTPHPAPPHYGKPWYAEEYQPPRRVHLLSNYGTLKMHAILQRNQNHFFFFYFCRYSYIQHTLLKFISLKKNKAKQKNQTHLTMKTW